MSNINANVPRQNPFSDPFTTIWCFCFYILIYLFKMSQAFADITYNNNSLFSYLNSVVTLLLPGISTATNYEFTKTKICFATTGVNVILTQIFLVPFVITLLNIYYPGEWYLSFIRILDVAIGGAIAVAMVYLAAHNSIFTHKIILTKLSYEHTYWLLFFRAKIFSAALIL